MKVETVLDSSIKSLCWIAVPFVGWSLAGVIHMVLELPFHISMEGTPLYTICILILTCVFSHWLLVRKIAELD